MEFTLFKNSTNPYFFIELRKYSPNTEHVIHVNSKKAVYIFQYALISDIEIGYTGRILEQGRFTVEAGIKNEIVFSVKKEAALVLTVALKIREKIDKHQEGDISGSMMLQILELVNQNDSIYNMPEETLLRLNALASSSINCINCSSKMRMSFYEAAEIYRMVNLWQHGLPREKPAEMSQNRFVTLFQELYGCSPTHLAYIINMRNAMNLLKRDEEPIISISQLSGYSNKENFIAAFRNLYGITPGQLRKHFRQNKVTSCIPKGQTLFVA